MRDVDKKRVALWQTVDMIQKFVHRLYMSSNNQVGIDLVEQRVLTTTLVLHLRGQQPHASTIAAAASLPRETTRRMLKRLQERGLVQLEGDAYRFVGDSHDSETDKLADEIKEIWMHI